jgi:hypothetical protein
MRMLTIRDAAARTEPMICDLTRIRTLLFLTPDSILRPVDEQTGSHLAAPYLPGSKSL